MSYNRHIYSLFRPLFWYWCLFQPCGCFDISAGQPCISVSVSLKSCFRWQQLSQAKPSNLAQIFRTVYAQNFLCMLSPDPVKISRQQQFLFYLRTFRRTHFFLKQLFPLQFSLWKIQRIFKIYKGKIFPMRFSFGSTGVIAGVHMLL